MLEKGCRTKTPNNIRSIRIFNYKFVNVTDAVGERILIKFVGFRKNVVIRTQFTKQFTESFWQIFGGISPK